MPGGIQRVQRGHRQHPVEPFRKHHNGVTPRTDDRPKGCAIVLPGFQGRSVPVRRITQRAAADMRMAQADQVRPLRGMNLRATAVHHGGFGGLARVRRGGDENLDIGRIVTFDAVKATGELRAHLGVEEAELPHNATGPDGIVRHLPEKWGPQKGEPHGPTPHLDA
mgnify:CR=1 FL=1